MMRDDIDLHVHTAHVGCANETMAVPALLERADQLGYRHVAITDHYNGPDHGAPQWKILEDLRAYAGPLDVTWGVELTIDDPDAGTLTADAETIEQFAWEFVIGGPHGRYGPTDPEEIIARQHQLMLDTMRTPGLDALVHPWWFGRSEFEEDGAMAWMTDMSRIPDWHTEELAECSVQTGTAIEMNGCAIITNDAYTPRFVDDYRAYMARLCELGATFTVASDAHDINRMAEAKLAAQFLSDAGVPDDRIVLPPASDLS